MLDFRGGGGQYWHFAQFLFNLSNVAVPYFFVVSGFFLATHCHEKGWWKREVSKRIFSLIVPFFIWSSVAVFVVASFDLLSHRSVGTGMFLFHNSPPTLLQFLGLDLTYFPILAPLWYLRCLFFLVILSPVIFSATKQLKWMWFCCLFIAPFVIGVLCRTEVKMFFECGLSLTGLFYFSIGMFLSFSHLRLQPMLSAHPCLGGWLALFGVSLLCYKVIAFGYCLPGQRLAMSLAIPFLILALWHFMPSCWLPEWLTACSFPIFLMHVIFFPFVDWLGQSLSSSAILAICRFIIGTGGSIAIALTLRKCAPRLSLWAFGGR